MSDYISLQPKIRIISEPTEYTDEMDMAFLQMLKDVDGNVIEFDGTPKFRPDEDHPVPDELE